MTKLRYEITIRARAEVIYRHLTERDGLVRWIGIDATAHPEPGGELTWTHENGATMIGRFIELDPPTRLVFAYGWKGNLMGLPPESTLVEIQLEEEPGHTLLVLTHHGLSEANNLDHKTGWEHFLTKLDQLLTSCSIAADPESSTEAHRA